MLYKIYEKVFTDNEGKKFISVLLNEKIQNEIDKFFIEDNKINFIIEDIIKFMDKNKIKHSKKIIRKSTYYIIGFTIEKENKDGSFELLQQNLDNSALNKIKSFINSNNYDNYIESLDEYGLKLKTSSNADIINSDLYDLYPKGLKNYLDNLQKELLNLINEIINIEFNSYFYPCKTLKFMAAKEYISNNYKIYVNIYVKFKNKEAKEQLVVLSDLLEKEF